MHILAPKPQNDAIPIFFNIDSSVGFLGNNSNRIDILLVQFLIHKSAELAVELNPERRQRMLRVKADGFVGPITIDGIKAVQETMRDRHPGTIVDGRVSQARGYEYGGGFWTIVSMNAAVRKRTQSFWPRLQDMAGCPAELKARSQQCL